jgi:hypothetical protein
VSDLLLAAGLLLAAALTPSLWRHYQWVAAAYDKCEPVCHFEQAQARSSSWWRSLLKVPGLRIDYTYSSLARAGTRKTKWVRLTVRPWWVPWPQRRHIRRCRVRIPGGELLKHVVPKLLPAIAEFFDVEERQLQVSVKRGLRRTWVTFQPTVPSAARADDRPRYADVTRLDDAS